MSVVVMFCGLWKLAFFADNKVDGKQSFGKDATTTPKRLGAVMGPLLGSSCHLGLLSSALLSSLGVPCRPTGDTSIRRLQLICDNIQALG